LVYYILIDSYIHYILCGRSNKPHYRSCPSVCPTRTGS